MPKFIVTKGHDALNYYSKVFEAESAEEANQLAEADRYNGGWVATGGNVEYDSSDIIEERTEPFDEETEEVDEIAVLEVSPEERDMIIAALRHWQQSGFIEPEIANIARNGRDFYLSDGEIDELCERING